MTDFKLILKLILDEATKKKAIKGIKEVQSEINSLGANAPAGGRSKKAQSVQIDTTETETVVKNSRKRKKAYEEEAVAIEETARRYAYINSSSTKAIPTNAIDITGKSRKDRDKIVLELMKEVGAERERQLEIAREVERSVAQLEKEGFQSTKEMAEGRVAILEEMAKKQVALNKTIASKKVDFEEGPNNVLVRKGWVEGEPPKLGHFPEEAGAPGKGLKYQQAEMLFVENVNLAAKAGEALAESETELSKTLDSTRDVLAEEAKAFQDAYNAKFKTVNGKTVDAETGQKASSDDVIAFTKFKKDTEQKPKSPNVTQSAKEERKELEALEKDIQKIASIYDMTTEEVENLSDAQFAQARGSIKEYEKLEQELDKVNKKYREQRREVERLTGSAERLYRMGQGLVIGGTAVVAGAFAMANREAQRQKSTGNVDETTKAWLKAQERIEKSTQRIGRAWEKTVLPYLEAAARIAEKASKYFEANPEISKAIFAAGAIAATIGGAIVLLSRGIRVIADFKYLAANAEFDLATRRFEASVNKMALSQALPGKGGLGKGGLLAGGTAGSIASIAATAAAVLAVIVAGATLGAIVYDLIAKYTGKTRLSTIAAGSANIVGQGIEKVAVAGGMDENEAKRKTLVFTYLIGRVFGAIKEGDPAWKSVVDGANKAAGALDEFGNTAEDEAEGFKILKDLAEEQAQAERQFADDRRDILIDSQRSLEDANRDLASTMDDIASNLVGAIKEIRADLKQTLADMESDFNEANLEAEKEYQEVRGEIISDGQKEIEQIREQGQRDLEQLEREHQQNLKGIIDDRDAYALDEENKAYEERKKEIEDGIALAIEQAQENTRLQLEEAARNYEEQRKQREEEYLKQKAEAEERAKQAIIDARAKAEEAKKQALADYEERKKEIDRETRQALEDLRRRFEDERRERVLAASQALQELGTNLQAEAELRRQYYDIILADLTQHMQDLANVQSSAGPASSNSSSKSGYTGSNSGSGFIADRPTTKLLEDAVGGKLSQANIANAASSNGAISILWEDHRVFSGEVSLATRNAIKNDTLAAVDLAIKKAQRKR